MAKTVDARGLPCPQPVILTKSAMREADEVTTLVTGTDQVANVRRLAEKAGWQVTVERQAEGLAVRMVKGQTSAEPELSADVTACKLPEGKNVVVVPSERMGRGEDELGGILVRSFFHALSEVEPLPSTIIFYNTGVKLAVEGSPVLEDLRVLEKKGVEVLVCGTCLGYFNLKDKLAAGAISNMYTIAETQLDAHHVITL